MAILGVLLFALSAVLSFVTASFIMNADVTKAKAAALKVGVALVPGSLLGVGGLMVTTLVSANVTPDMIFFTFSVFLVVLTIGCLCLAFGFSKDQD